MTQELYKTITPINRLLITVVVMAATLMQVIDTTIVNVALPHMQGSLSASPDEITWTLTSYLVASAIFMPLTGYFSDRFGRKKYLIFSILGFTVVSALCGASQTITQIVLFRMLQGVFGAALVPLSQAIMTDIFPPEERGKAMAIWGIGVMVGPILGPTLGGYLTDIASWRWTFYVNIPVGVFTLLLSRVLPDTPTKSRGMDWTGLILISLAIGGLQFVLDRGNSDDWFSSITILIVSYITLTGFFGFLFHNMQENKRVVFDLRIFKDRNFSLACLLLAMFGLGMYGMMVIQPMMMESLLNYPVITAGFLLAPRGISGMISMMLISKLINRFDPRWLIITGILLCLSGTWLCTFYSLNITQEWLIYPMLLQGFGLGMIFVPIGTVAFATLPMHMRTEAAGLYSLLRTIGGSVGISITITIFARRSQFFWNELGGFINPYNPAVYSYLQRLHLDPNSQAGSMLLGGELARQANMEAFINVFAFVMWSFVIMIPLVLLLKPAPQKAPAVELAAE